MFNQSEFKSGAIIWVYFYSAVAMWHRLPLSPSSPCICKSCAWTTWSDLATAHGPAFPSWLVAQHPCFLGKENAWKENIAASSDTVVTFSSIVSEESLLKKASKYSTITLGLQKPQGNKVSGEILSERLEFLRWGKLKDKVWVWSRYIQKKWKQQQNTSNITASEVFLFVLRVRGCPRK